MSDKPLFLNEDDRIDWEATEWLARESAGFSPEERQQFEKWLAADDRHRETIEAYQEMRSGFSLLIDSLPEDAAKPDPDLLAPAEEKRRLPKFLVPIAAAGLAACLALVFFLRPAAVDPDPATAAPARAYTEQLAAATLQRHFLPDGTLLELREGAAVEARYSDRERSLDLIEGEVHFSVAEDASRPFVVRAGGAAFKAVGTAFNIRLSNHEVELLVTEGVVAVDPAPDSDTRDPAAEAAPIQPTLQKTQRTKLSRIAPARSPIIETIDSSSLNERLSWKRETLTFENTPLSEAIAEFNRRNRDQLVIEDAELRKERIDGIFRSDDLEAFTEIMQIATGVKVTRAASRKIILHR